MQEKKFKTEWNDLFKKAEQQFLKFKELNNISNIWIKWHKNNKTKSTGYKVITGHSFEIKELPRII